MNPFLLPRRPDRTREREEPRPQRKLFSAVDFPEFDTRQVVETSNDRLHIRREFVDGRSSPTVFRFALNELEPLEVALSLARSEVNLRRAGAVPLKTRCTIELAGGAASVCMRLRLPDGRLSKKHLRLSGTELTALACAIDDLKTRKAHVGT